MTFGAGFLPDNIGLWAAKIYNSDTLASNNKSNSEK
jgi:hypothetical protein